MKKIPLKIMENQIEHFLKNLNPEEALEFENFTGFLIYNNITHIKIPNFAIVENPLEFFFRLEFCIKNMFYELFYVQGAKYLSYYNCCRIEILQKDNKSKKNKMALKTLMAEKQFIEIFTEK